VAGYEKILSSLNISHPLIFKMHSIGFGGLEVACWPLVPKLMGLNQTEADFSWQKNPQHAFLQGGSNAISPMLKICSM
jgi:hypothetical protein